MKCPKCGKPQKENTEGNNRYCQGHSIFETKKDIFCNGCMNLKYNKILDINYCDIFCLRISGTLERLEKCKELEIKERCCKI